LGGISIENALPGMVETACRAKPLLARRLLRALMYVPEARIGIVASLLKGNCPVNCLPDLAASASLSVDWKGEERHQAIAHIEQLLQDDRLPEALRTTCIALLAEEIKDPNLLSLISKDVIAGKQYATTTLMSLSPDRVLALIK